MNNNLSIAFIQWSVQIQEARIYIHHIKTLIRSRIFFENQGLKWRILEHIVAQIWSFLFFATLNEGGGLWHLWFHPVATRYVILRMRSPHLLYVYIPIYGI